MAWCGGGSIRRPHSCSSASRIASISASVMCSMPMNSLRAVSTARISSSSLAWIAAGVAVLRVLHQEHHQEGDDGGAGVDDELPVLGEAEQRSGQRPDDHPAEREHEGERLAGEGGDPPGEGGEGAVHSGGEVGDRGADGLGERGGPTGKTWCGVPAAAQIVAKSSSRGSSQASIGVRWPSGATPPIAKPVTARTEAASAFSSARAGQRAPPCPGRRGCRRRSGTAGDGPTPASRNTIDLTIWSSSQPQARAASAAVRVPSSRRTGVDREPAAGGVGADPGERGALGAQRSSTST